MLDFNFFPAWKGFCVGLPPPKNLGDWPVEHQKPRFVIVGLVPWQKLSLVAAFAPKMVLFRVPELNCQVCK